MREKEPEVLWQKEGAARGIIMCTFSCGPHGDCVPAETSSNGSSIAKAVYCQCHEGWSQSLEYAMFEPQAESWRTAPCDVFTRARVIHHLHTAHFLCAVGYLVFVGSLFLAGNKKVKTLVRDQRFLILAGITDALACGYRIADESAVYGHDAFYTFTYSLPDILSYLWLVEEFERKLKIVIKEFEKLIESRKTVNAILKYCTPVHQIILTINYVLISPATFFGGRDRWFFFKLAWGVTLLARVSGLFFIAFVAHLLFQILTDAIDVASQLSKSIDVVALNRLRDTVRVMRFLAPLAGVIIATLTSLVLLTPKWFYAFKYIHPALYLYLLASDYLIGAKLVWNAYVVSKMRNHDATSSRSKRLTKQGTLWRSNFFFSSRKTASVLPVARSEAGEEDDTCDQSNVKSTGRIDE